MSVERVIARHLGGGRAVAIPSVGVLYVDILGAEQCDGGRRMVAPERVVRVGDFDACTLTEYVAADMNVDDERAQEIVNEWLADANDGERLVIDGVGEFIYRNGEFFVCEAFSCRLNPLTGDKIVINNSPKSQLLVGIKPPRTPRNTFGITLALICALAALGYIAFYFREQLQLLISSLIR